MTEDLKYTKIELEVADSIILHQREIIKLKDQTIDLKTQELQENIKKSTNREIRIGIGAGILGIALGIIFGVFL